MFRHAQLESVKAWIGDPAHAALPLHARIQRAIRQLILDGAIDVGRPLPASRALARSLAVSRDTVEAAYGQLHAEGFIERRVGSGSFVSERVRQRRAGARRTPAYATPSPGLSRRGAMLFHNGGVRDFLAPRAFAPGLRGPLAADLAEGREGIRHRDPGFVRRLQLLRGLRRPAASRHRGGAAAPPFS